MMDTLRLSRDLNLRKAAIVAYLASFLGGEAHLTVAARRLSLRQWQALAYRRLQEGPVPLSSIEVRLEAQGASDAEVAADLEGLFSTGCLLFVEQPTFKEKLDPSESNLADGRYSDLRVIGLPRVLALARQKCAGADFLGWAAGHPTQVRLGSFVDVQRETFLALRAAADGQLRLTARSVPFRADVARLAASTSGQPAKAKGKRTRASEVPVPVRLWFVLAVLMASDLTRVQEGKLVATPEAQAFFRAPAAEQARQLFAAWLDCCFSEFFRITSLDLTHHVEPDFAWVDPGTHFYGVSDIPTWQSLKLARRSVVEAILQGAAGRSDQWLSLGALSTSIRADDPSFLITTRPPSYGYSPFAYGGRRARYYEGIRRKDRRYPENQLSRDRDWGEVEGAYIAQVLAEPLYWLGLLDRGEGPEGQLVSFRLTPVGRHVLLGEPLPDEDRSPAAGPALVVQPNFDLVVLDAFGSLGLLSQVDDFAERGTLDRAATFRLTRESVVRGFERGHTGQSILSLLEEASRAPVPQNVRYSVEEWSRLYERIHLRSAASLLVADSPEQLTAWLADERLGRLLGRPLSPTAVLVPAEQAGAVATALAERGEAPLAFDYRQPLRQVFKVAANAALSLRPEVDEPYVRYRLGRFADPAEPGAAHFQITPRSIERALAGGMTAEDVATFLREFAEGDVPADALLRVRGWAGVYGRLHFREAVAVEAPPGLLWTELRVVPEVRAALIRLPSPTVALLEPARFEAARAALAERGLIVEPAPLARRGGTPPQEAPADGRRGDRDRRDLPVRAIAERRGSAKRAILHALPPLALRTFLEVAAREERRVLVGLVVSDGARVAFPLRPTRVRKSDGQFFVDGYCDACDELHTLLLDEVIGVGDADRVASRE